jgi:O-antigen/teichoic acid export membrane protein
VTASTPPRSQLLRGTALIAVAMAVMNLGTYGFTVVAARLLGPREYGALAAVMGLLLVLNVVSLGLQATGARRVSAAPEHLDRTEADVLAATYRSAIAVGALCLLFVPVVTVVLRLDSWLVAGMVALTAVPLTVMGGQAGVLQGERRWFALAGVYLGMGLGRVVFGAAALWLEADTVSAMTGVALGAAVPVLIGGAALRHRAGAARRVNGARGAPGEQPPVGRSRRVVRELAHNSHALLAFFALTNVDVVIARITLDEYHSGLYAGGLILAKAVLFLPQFVVVLAFPAMSAAGARTTMAFQALAAVLVIGAGATLGAWLFSDLAVVFVGGPAYAPLTPWIWGFAGVGTIWAMIHLLVYNVVARQTRTGAVALWLGLVALMALAPAVSSVAFLLGGVLLVNCLVLVTLVGLVVRVGLRLRATRQQQLQHR